MNVHPVNLITFMKMIEGPLKEHACFFAAARRFKYLRRDLLIWVDDPRILNCELWGPFMQKVCIHYHYVNIKNTDIL